MLRIFKIRCTSTLQPLCASWEIPGKPKQQFSLCPKSHESENPDTSSCAASLSFLSLWVKFIPSTQNLKKTEWNHFFPRAVLET